MPSAPLSAKVGIIPHRVTMPLRILRFVWLSSTISTRTPSRSSAGATALGSRTSSGTISGNTKWKCEPTSHARSQPTSFRP